MIKTIFQRVTTSKKEKNQTQPPARFQELDDRQLQQVAGGADLHHHHHHHHHQPKKK